MLNIKFKSKSRWIKPEYFMQNKAIEYLLFSEGIKYILETGVNSVWVPVSSVF